MVNCELRVSMEMPNYRRLSSEFNSQVAAAAGVLVGSLRRSGRSGFRFVERAW